jgi:hypothetical protein
MEEGVKTTAEMIEVMQAYERGEVIESRPCRENSKDLSWEHCSQLQGGERRAPGWHWGYWDYRIKPKAPREFWVHAMDLGSGHLSYAVSDKKNIAIHATVPVVDIIHVREVL